jgi:hypothetical protein
MRNIQITSVISNKILYEGKFRSVKACLEQAARDKANLEGADLRHANLANANLDEIILPRAILSGSNMSGANLSEAVLTDVDFSSTALYNACLCGSDLRRCNFTDASFGATDIAGANIAGSRFSTLSSFHLDFSAAEDMRGCIFHDPAGPPCAMSRPPVVISGLLSAPVIIFDRHIKIGGCVRAHEQWFNLLAARLLSDHTGSKIAAVQ